MNPVSDTTFECYICGEYHAGTIVTQSDAVKRYKVGDRAFPEDFNWVCPCGSHNRAFEDICPGCEYDAVRCYHPTVTVG